MAVDDSAPGGIVAGHGRGTICRPSICRSRGNLAMSTYFRWVAPGPDLILAKAKVLQASASPRSACWIFDMAGLWKPSVGISSDRVLVAFTFNDLGQQIITNPSKWIRFPGEEFVGEAKHPDGIIVKSNEPGATAVCHDGLASILAYQAEILAKSSIGRPAARA